MEFDRSSYRRFFLDLSHRPAGRSASRCRALRFEPLESRRPLALLADVVAGDLTIVESSPADNSLTLSRIGDQLEIRDTLDRFVGAPVTSPPSATFDGGRTLRVPATAVPGELLVAPGAGVNQIRIGAGVSYAASGAVQASIAGLAGSTIRVRGAAATLGVATSSQGFETAGELIVGAGSLTLLDANAALLGASTTLAGGLLRAPAGLSLSAGDVLSGYGLVDAPLAGNTGLVRADTAGGVLTIGRANSNSGFVGGDVQVAAGARLVLLDANGATVNRSRIDGVLQAASGVVLNSGRTLSGAGRIEGRLTALGTLAPGGADGAGAGRLTVAGDLTVAGALAIDLGEPSTSTGVRPSDRIEVVGAVDLTGATLELNVAPSPAPATDGLQTWTIVDNDGATDPIAGRLAGLPEGAAIDTPAGRLYLSYVGGDGNDLTLADRPSLAATPAPDLFHLVRRGAWVDVLRTNASSSVVASFLNPATLHLTGIGASDRITIDLATADEPLVADGLFVDGDPFDASTPPVVELSGSVEQSVAWRTSTVDGAEVRRLQVVDRSTAAPRLDATFSPAAEFVLADFGRVNLEGPAGATGGDEGRVDVVRIDGADVEGGRTTSVELSVAAGSRASYAGGPVEGANRGAVELTAEASSASRLTVALQDVGRLELAGAGGTLELHLGGASASAPAALRMTGSGSGGSFGAGSPLDGVNLVASDSPVDGPIPVRYAGFDTVFVRGGAGEDRLLVVDVDGAAPLGRPGAAPLRRLIVDADDRANSDSSDDWIGLESPPSDVDVWLLGGRGADTFAIQSLDGADRSAPGASAGSRAGRVYVAPTAGRIVDEADASDRLLATPAELGPNGSESAPRVVDDGGPGYFQTGDWRADTPGFQGASRRNSPGVGAETAVWAFDGLEAGYYQAAATWPAKPWDNSPAAAFRTTGADGETTTVVDQRVAPRDLYDLGAAWERLGSPVRVAVDGGSIVVRLDDRAPQSPVVADAVRLVRLNGPAIRLFDADCDVELSNDGTLRVDFGTAVHGAEPVERRFVVRNYGARPGLFQRLELPPGYELSESPATVVPAADGGGYGETSFRIRLPSTSAGPFVGELRAWFDAEPAPRGVVLAGRIVHPAPTARRLDDGDPGYHDSGWLDSAARGSGGDQRQLPFNAIGAQATWTFADLRPGAVYRAAASWAPLGGAAPAAPFEIFDGPIADARRLGGRLVNQSQPPDDFFTDGVAWEDLGGGYRVGPSGTLVVRLGRSAAGAMLADSVRIEPQDGPELDLVDSPNGRSLAGPLHGAFDSTVLEFDKRLVGEQGAARRLTVRNLGEAPLTIRAAELPEAFVWAAPWPTSVAPGDAVTGTIAVRSDLPAGDYTGDLTLVTDDSDEHRMSVRLTARVELPIVVVDDGDPGFQANGTFQRQTGLGFGGDNRLAPADSSGVAVWTFTDLPDGLYSVATTWPTGPSPGPHARARSATYLLHRGESDGPSGKRLVVDQREAPNDLQAESRGWEEFPGPIAVVDGRLQVTLSSTGAGGLVSADAVRVARLVRPELQVSLDGRLAASGLSTLDFGVAFIAGPTPTRQVTLTNVGPGLLDLPSTFLAPDGYRILSDSGPEDLATGEVRTLTVGMNVVPGGAPGSLNSADSIAGDKGRNWTLPSGDDDEGAFVLSLRGRVERTLIVDAHAAPASPFGFAVASTVNGFRSVSGGYLNRSWFATSNASTTATVSAGGLPAGVYRVSATWTPRSTWASDSPMRINQGPLRRVNQRAAPDDRFDSGVGWEDLGTVEVAANGTIVVTIGGAVADRFVTADAVRFEWESAARDAVFAGWT